MNAPEGGFKTSFLSVNADLEEGLITHSCTSLLHTEAGIFPCAYKLAQVVKPAVLHWSRKIISQDLDADWSV